MKVPAPVDPPRQPSPATADSLLSSYRESLLEHVFSAEVMRHLWLRGNTRIETLKPQVDDGGYDLVLEANGVVRHVQLKASHLGSSTRQVNANTHLMKKPSGCVIWLWFDKTTLALGPFRWFGGPPGRRLPDITNYPIAKHTKGNSKGTKLDRPNLRVIKKKQFEVVKSIDELIFKLFGTFKQQ